MKKTCIAFISGLALISCGPNDNTLGEKAISKEQYGNKWPFTVSEGKLKCIQYETEGINQEMIQGVIFETNGKTYGLNGTAKSWGRKLGYAKVDEIWADDTIQMDQLIKAGVPIENAKMKVNIGQILDEGLELCNTK